MLSIFAYNENGCNYFSEFHNNHDRINEIIEDSSRKGELDNLYAKFFLPADDLSESAFNALWNEYMNLTIQLLKEAGCNIIWDRV
jgi:hypothetical protein